MKTKFVWLAVFPLIILSTLFLYKTSLNYYFFQDDWFVLSIVNNIRPSGLLEIFKVRDDVIYYRPIGMQLFFYIGKYLFGLDPLGYHLISFAFHTLNTFLIGLISYQLFKSKLASAISSFFYATAPFHFMTMSWVSLTWNTIGTFFVLSSAYFFLHHLHKFNLKTLILSLTAMILGSLTSEFALVIPAVLLLIGFISVRQIKKEHVKRSLFFLVPSGIVLLVYTLLRIIIFPIQATGDYQIILGQQILNNVAWYGFWLLGIPEEFKYQVVFSQLRITDEMFRAAGSLLLPLFISLSFFIVLIPFIVINNMNKTTVKILSAVFALFLIGLAPILLIPYHTYPYYLNTPSIGAFIFIGYLFRKIKLSVGNGPRTILVLFLVISWYCIAYLNTEITSRTSWIPGEAAISKEVSNYVLRNLSHLPRNASLLIISNDQEKMKQSIMGQNALNILLKDKNIKTYFDKETLIEDFNEGSLVNDAQIHVFINEK